MDVAQCDEYFISGHISEISLVKRSILSVYGAMYEAQFTK